MDEHFNSNTKEYKKLWNKYYSGGYDFETADRLFKEELANPKIKPKKDKGDVGKKTLTWTKWNTISMILIGLLGIVLTLLALKKAGVF